MFGYVASTEATGVPCESEPPHNHYPGGEGVATSPGGRARLRFQSPDPACETKEVPPRRLTTAVPWPTTTLCLASRLTQRRLSCTPPGGGSSSTGILTGAIIPTRSSTRS